MGRKKDESILAIWKKNVKVIFYDLCLIKVEQGNHPTTFFRKEGWTNIVICFEDKTSRGVQ